MTRYDGDKEISAIENHEWLVVIIDDVTMEIPMLKFRLFAAPLNIIQSG